MSSRWGPPSKLPPPPLPPPPVALPPLEAAKDETTATIVEDYELLTEVEWGPSKEDPHYDTDQELAPKPLRRTADVCECRPAPGKVSCLDSSCLLFACQEECSKKHCPAGMQCGNRRLQQPEKLPTTQIFEAGPKGRGLRVLEAVQAGQVIIEYTGQAIVQKHLGRLFRRYQWDRRLYILALGNGVYLDARRKGGPARFINHSCRPNCRVERWKVKNVLRAAVVAITDIAAGQELTFDYQWERQPGRAPTKCHCGSDNCRGTLEVSLEELPLQDDGVSDVEQPELQSSTSGGQWLPVPQPVDQTLVNRVVRKKISSPSEQETWLLGEVTGYNPNTKQHCILYRHDLSEVWHDLSSDAWQVLDSQVAPEHWHIAKKMTSTTSSASQQRRLSSPSLLDETLKLVTPPVKHYLYVPTHSKDALFSTKHYLLERCQRTCSVQVTAEPVSAAECENAQVFQSAQSQSSDGIVWKVSITGSDVARAHDILTKAVMGWEKKRLMSSSAMDSSRTTSPTMANAANNNTLRVSDQVILPRLVVEELKRKMQSVRDKCRNVTLQFAPSASKSKQFSRLVLEGSLVSDVQTAKDVLWNVLSGMCVQAQVPMQNNNIPRHLGFYAGSLTQEQVLLLSGGHCQTVDGQIDWSASPLIRSFESTYKCTIWIQADDDQGRIDSRNQMVAVPTPTTPRQVFMGCPPQDVSRLWGLIQARTSELERGVKYLYLGADRIYQPFMMKNGGQFFDYVRSVAGATVTIDSITGDHLKIDGKVSVVGGELTQMSEKDRASLAEEIIRLQIELYRDNCIRESPWIFGRDWTMACTEKAAVSSSEQLVEAKALGRLDVASAAQGGMDIAEIVNRLGLSGSVAAHAVIILYRFVHAKPEPQIKLREALLACVFLANKAQKAIKWNRLETVLEAGYKTLYHGTKFDRKKEEAAVLEERVITAEAEILESLQFDVFWRDIEWMKEAAAGAGGMKEKFINEVFDFAFSGQVLSAGAELWLKYGPEYVFAASAAFLKANLDKLLPALSLIPLKVSQAAELLAETAKVGHPTSKHAPSHTMLESGKDRLERQLARIKEACVEAMKKGVVAAQPLTTSAASVSTQRYSIIAQRSRQRRQFVGLSKDIIMTNVLPVLDAITLESGSNIYLADMTDKDTSDIVIEGHWRAVSIAEYLLLQEINSPSVDCPSSAKEQLRLQVKTQPGLLSASAVQVSNGWEGAVQSSITQASACARLGGKSCIPGRVEESSLREAGLRWWVVPQHGLSLTGSLNDMHIVRQQSRSPLDALASMVKSVMGGFSDFPQLELVAKSNGENEEERSIPVSLQRWPPEKVGKRESDMSQKSKGNNMRIGFSAVALQEMQLLTQLHTAVPTPQGHPNFVLPVAIAMPHANNGNDESPSPVSETKKQQVAAPFDDSMVFSLFRSSDENDKAAESDKKVKSSPHIVHQPAPFILQRFISRKMREVDDLAISPVIISSWCHDLLSALVHCHSNHVVLRSIQPDQIVVDHAGVIKLGSLYRCTVLSTSERKEKVNILAEAKSSKKRETSDGDNNTHPLAAPEHLLGCPRHTKESDVWAVGCLLASLLLNKPLFIGKDRASLLASQFKVVGSPSKDNFVDGKSLPNYSKEAKKYRRGVERALETMLKDKSSQYKRMIDLIARMLHLDPKKRCTAAEALGHDFMVEFVEKCSGSKDFREEYVTDWLDLKRRMMDSSGAEQTAERKKKRKAMIAAATGGARSSDNKEDDLYDMDDLLDVTAAKKQKAS